MCRMPFADEIEARFREEEEEIIDHPVLAEMNPDQPLELLSSSTLDAFLENNFDENNNNSQFDSLLSETMDEVLARVPVDTLDMPTTSASTVDQSQEIVESSQPPVKKTVKRRLIKNAPVNTIADNNDDDDDDNIFDFLITPASKRRKPVEPPTSDELKKKKNKSKLSRKNKITPAYAAEFAEFGIGCSAMASAAAAAATPVTSTPQVSAASQHIIPNISQEPSTSSSTSTHLPPPPPPPPSPASPQPPPPPPATAAYELYVPATQSQQPSCTMSHKRCDLRTIVKMVKAREFSDTAVRVQKNGRNRQQEAEAVNPTQNGSKITNNTKVHFLNGPFSRKERLPSTVLSVRTASNGKVEPKNVFLNGRNAASTENTFISPRIFIDYVDHFDKYMEDPIPYYSAELAPGICIVLQRFSTKVMVINNLKEEKVCYIDFENHRQMTAYLSAIRELATLIQHQLNVPVARRIFDAKVDEMFHHCTCDRKDQVLSNLGYLYYNYIDIIPLPYHLEVNNHLFTAVEKFMMN